MEAWRVSSRYDIEYKSIITEIRSKSLSEGKRKKEKNNERKTEEKIKK